MRSQIQWLIRITNNDLEMRLPVSIYSLDSLKLLPPSDSVVKKWKFELKDEFADMKFVRLIGISAIIIGHNSNKAYFDLSITSPPLLSSETAQVSTGPAPPYPANDFILRESQTIRLPRCTSYTPSRTADTAGLKTLINRDPEGEWWVELNKITPTATMTAEELEALGDIEDVLLEFSIRYQSK